jgi:hypothetical protein
MKREQLQSGQNFEIKENAVATTCSSHDGDEKCIKKFKLENMKGRDHFGDLTIDGR